MTDRHTAVAEVADNHSLYSAFRTIASQSPGAPAVVGFDGKVSSYSQLLEAADAIAEDLSVSADIDLVLGLAVDDPFTFLAVYFAAAKLAWMVVLLDSRLSTNDRKRRAAHFDLDMLVFDGPAGPGSIRLEPVRTPCGKGADSKAYLTTDFVIHCTSGSTGEPKGIVLSQAAILARARSWAHQMSLQPSDVVLCALPLWHCHGIDMLTVPALLSGAKIIYMRGAHLTGRGLARTISAYSVTFISGLPVMYQMLTAAEGLDPSMLTSLRLAITGSAPISAETQSLFRKRFGLPLQQVYGLSEIGAITYDADFESDGTIGKPVPDIDWRLELTSVYAGDTRLSELYVRGPSLARGYYRDESATAEMFVDGWLRTHDLIDVQLNGWYIRGRKSSYVNVAGSKVAPIEVETALRDCAGIVDCAVVGVPDDDNGEQVVALIIAEPELDLNTLRREASSRLLPYQIPQIYRIASAVPRTAIGKTDYDAVKRMVCRVEGLKG